MKEGKGGGRGGIGGEMKGGVERYDERRGIREGGVCVEMLDRGLEED